MATAPEWVTLEADEEVLWTGQPRVRRILSNVATFLVWTVVGFVVAFLATSFLGDLLGVPALWVWGGAVVWALLLAVGPVNAYLRTVNTDFVLTDANVYKKTGVLSENVTRVGVDKIQNTQLRKDFFGNLFDYGTVHLSTAGGGGVEMTIEDLDDPDELRQTLRTVMARASEGTGRRGDRPADGRLDPETVEALLEEARRMRETAEAIEGHL